MATTDKRRLLTFRSTSYFNLAGDGQRDIWVMCRLRASRYTPVDSTLIPRRARAGGGHALRLPLA